MLEVELEAAQEQELEAKLAHIANVTDLSLHLRETGALIHWECVKVHLTSHLLTGSGGSSHAVRWSASSLNVGGLWNVSSPTLIYFNKPCVIRYNYAPLFTGPNSTNVWVRRNGSSNWLGYTFHANRGQDGASLSMGPTLIDSGDYIEAFTGTASANLSALRTSFTVEIVRR